jgi:hypothetical protein
LDRQKLLEQLDDLEEAVESLVEVAIASEPKDWEADHLSQLPSPKTDSGDMLQK